MKHRLLGNKYGSRYTTLCHNAVANIVADSTPAYISQCAFHLWIYMTVPMWRYTFLQPLPNHACEFDCSTDHNCNVIPFHIRSCTVTTKWRVAFRWVIWCFYFWWAKFFRMLLQFSAKNQSSFLYFRWTFLCQPSGLFFDIQNFIICHEIFSLNSGRMPSKTAPGITACRKHLTDLSLTKLFGNSACKIWLRSSCFALGPPSILQTSFPNNFVGPVSNIYSLHPLPYIHDSSKTIRTVEMLKSNFCTIDQTVYAYNFTEAVPKSWHYTSKCMHGMNQTEAEYPRHSKRSQTASLSQISPVPSTGDITRYLLHVRRICHLT